MLRLVVSCLFHSALEIVFPSPRWKKVSPVSVEIQESTQRDFLMVYAWFCVHDESILAQ